MPTLFVLDVPEFAPIARALGAAAGVARHKHGAYWAFSREGEIALERARTEIGEAIWFGVLTGGFEGRVAEFTAERLRLVAA